MAIELIDKIKPKNNGTFAMVDAEDVAMPDGTRLSEYNPGNGLPDVTDSDNGNVLAVVGGKWQSVVPEIPDELPDVSAEDENKILQVVGGKIVLVKVDDSSVKTFVDEYISSALEGDY